jgi:hypothetical protein
MTTPIQRVKSEFSSERNRMECQAGTEAYTEARAIPIEACHLDGTSNYAL